MIRHEELIAAGYVEETCRSCADGYASRYIKEFTEGHRLIRREWSEDKWEVVAANLTAVFHAETIEQAEAFAHLLHAASQGLPAVRVALAYMEENCVNMVGEGFADQSQEMQEVIAAAVAEIGGVE